MSETKVFRQVYAQGKSCLKSCPQKHNKVALKSSNVGTSEINPKIT